MSIWSAFKHYLLKELSTTVKTPLRYTLEEVSNDIDLFKREYEKLGMKCIDLEFFQDLVTSDEIENGKSYTVSKQVHAAKLYFRKDDQARENDEERHQEV